MLAFTPCEKLFRAWMSLFLTMNIYSFTDMLPSNHSCFFPISPSQALETQISAPLRYVTTRVTVLARIGCLGAR